jgi:hypothetical protein
MNKPLVLLEPTSARSPILDSDQNIVIPLEYSIVTPKNLLVQSATINILGQSFSTAICSLEPHKRSTGAHWGLQADIILPTVIRLYDELYVSVDLKCRSHNEEDLLEYSVATASIYPKEIYERLS